MSENGVSMDISQMVGQEFEKSLAINNSNIDKENRTVELSFSSNEPYARWGDTKEVLVHTEEAIDFSRLNNSAALLSNHNRSKQIGVIQEAWLDSNKCRAKVKFSKRAEAEEIYQDIQDGIIKNISVGYMVLEAEYIDTTDTVYIKKWQPYEISTVSVPADHTVGIGRSAKKKNKNNINHQKGETNMSDNTTPAIAEPTISPADTLKAERARVSEINALANEHNVRELADEHINSDTTADAFRSLLLSSIATRNKATLAQRASASPIIDTARSGGANTIGMTDNEVRSYSWIKALEYLSNPTAKNAERAAFEIEMSETAIRKLGKDATFMVPADVLQRGFDTTNGGSLVGTELQPNSFIKMLENKSIILPLVKKLTGLQGNIDIPMQVAGSSAYWIGEGEDAPDGDYATSKITLSPKTVAVKHDISRKMLLNATPSAEQLIKDDLISAIALEIDRAILYGIGGKQPLGLNSTTGVGTFTFANDLALDAFIMLETLISQNNADVNNMRYLLNPVMRGMAKSTPKTAQGEAMIWEPNNTINGYSTEVSNQIDAVQVIFGDFSQILLGMWDGLSLQVDPYTKAAQGAIRIIAMQDVDVAVKRPEAFAIGTRTV